MTTIKSVLGPLDTAGLGFTLPHEHLIDSSAGILDTSYDWNSEPRPWTWLCSPLPRPRMGVHSSFAAPAAGLDVPRSFLGRDKDFIADLWVREIEQGIERTGIKAGIIKVATSDPITEQKELMLRAPRPGHTCAPAFPLPLPPTRRRSPG